MRARYQSSRELFEAAREASKDAAKISAELRALDERSRRISSPTFESRSRSSTRPDAIGDAVAHVVDRGAVLDRRLEDDYRLIDSACAVLYGRDGMSDGLSAIAPPWWADAIYHHYLALRTWTETAALLAYSPRHIQECVRAAFDLMDANGMAATVDGTGCAEG